jgi:hypothetical protein
LQAPLQHAPAAPGVQAALAGRQQCPKTPPSVAGAQVGKPPEQQSLVTRHGWPGCAHWQVLPVQLPVQHWEGSVQAALLKRQQLPPSQVSLPQHVKPEHAAPSGVQHVPPLHTPPEQHGSPALQL